MPEGLSPLSTAPPRHMTGGLHLDPESVGPCPREPTCPLAGAGHIGEAVV